jgi:outer membrane protein OmpA-like peptidoglycan-associated protein
VKLLNWKNLIIFIFLILIIYPNTGLSQGSVGLPFLKIGTGARQNGMGGVFAGIADDVYAIYWNPGGIGHIRRWQWSLGYNKWFADIYQANFSMVKQFRLLGSRKTSWGLSCTYLGMPSWDATEGRAENVTANHIVAGISFGQRLDWISKALSVGITLKTIRSNLADYYATGVASDFGFLLKSNRFQLGKWGIGLFDYGIFSTGISLSHLGTEMKFDEESTSLPLTLRAGVALKVGKYKAWSLLVASDLISVKNRDLTAGLGSEIWWRDILGFRFGYQFNGEDLGGFSFGFGFRWDDVLNSLLGLPKKFGDAMEMNLAGVNYGDVLQQTYRGTFTHYPNIPEPFILSEPEKISSGYTGNTTVHLSWEQSYDPDPFDDIDYILVIDKDKSRLKKSINWLEKDMKSFLNSALKDSLHVCTSVPTTSYSFSPPEGGLYYWAVTAFDRSYHTKLAKKGSEQVASFIIDVPDLIVKDISFSPLSLITTTSEQGRLSIHVSNEGTTSSDSCRFVVYDIFIDGKQPENEKIEILNKTIFNFNPGLDTTFHIYWSTRLSGLHKIHAIIDPDSLILELKESNNIKSGMFYTIPKGKLIVPDSLEVMVTGFEYAEVPVVPAIFFNPHSDKINSYYYEEMFGISSALESFADRLIKFPEIVLRILGSIDLMSDEKDPILAELRAENVKRKLIDLGVPDSQLVVVKNHPEKFLGRRRRNRSTQDTKWVMEQNRVVNFKVAQEHEEKIFTPYPIAVDTTSRDNVLFKVRIVAPAGIHNWTMEDSAMSIGVNEDWPEGKDSLWIDFAWMGTDRQKVLVPRNRWYPYSLIIIDSLNNTFHTPFDSVYLQEKNTIRRQEIFGAAKFGKIEPVYQFYWNRLMDVAEDMIANPNMKLRFEGHACAIGSDEINEKLSHRRAERFTEAFLKRVKKNFPDYYEDINNRIEPPVGFGEKEPFRLKMKGRKEMLFGDNNSPVGRYLNRRIQVLLYQEN